MGRAERKWGRERGKRGRKGNADEAGKNGRE